MTERNPPVWMQSGTYSAADDRMVTGLLFDQNIDSDGTFNSLEGGVVPGVDQLEVTSTGAMGYRVSGGIVAIPAIGINPPGIYLCYNDGNFNDALDIEGSGNPRVDLIVAEAEDQAAGGLTSVWRITVRKGDPAPSPTAKSPLTNQIPLAEVVVRPASLNGGINKITNADITDRRRFVASRGGVHLVWDGQALPSNSPGRLYFNNADKTLNLFTGTGSPERVLTSKSSGDASNRPREAQNTFKVKTSSTTPNQAPLRTDTVASISPIQITNLSSPSGLFKVTLAAYGRVTKSGNAGFVGVRVLQGSTAVIALSSTSSMKTLSFYDTVWQHTAITYLYNLTAVTDYTFQVQFWMPDGPNTEQAQFKNTYLMVEPVL